MSTIPLEGRGVGRPVSCPGRGIIANGIMARHPVLMICRVEMLHNHYGQTPRRLGYSSRKTSVISVATESLLAMQRHETG
jgi:hypothetical protein